MPATVMLAAALVALTASGPSQVADHAPSASPPASSSDSPVRPSIGFLSASALRERCESNSAGLVSYCYAYVIGVHDTVQAYETWLRVREFCAPQVSSQSDMRRAFLSYLDKNPGAASGEAASVIVLALKDQFGCASSGVPTSTGATKPTPSATKK
jgi:hypothetical protein